MPTKFASVLDEQPDQTLYSALARVGYVFLPSSTYSTTVSLPNSPYNVVAESTAPPSLDDVVQWLDRGADKAIVSPSTVKQVVGIIPPERLILLLDMGSVSTVSDSIRSSVSGILVKTTSVDIEFLSHLKTFFSGLEIYVLPATSSAPEPSTIRRLQQSGITLVIPSSQLTIGPPSPSRVNVVDAFLAPLTSDRPDGLFPTVVSAYNHGGRSLGLVYSSRESVRESIITGRGVYQSRKHGLWRKGETSGATQAVVSIRADCDADSLEFSVVQSGTGFCHLGTTSCFGSLDGISALEVTLQSRLQSAPEGSYTKRLFTSPDLLRSKIMEEADELCRAETKEAIAFEAADLLYFALARCVSQGVAVSDIERSLDKKAHKITRRSGNAKPQWSKTSMSTDLPVTLTPSTALPPSDPKLKPSKETSIRMRIADLSSISPSTRSELLRRPVLKSGEMIAKVKPIVDEVRSRGDAALIEFTSKFDKAKLTSTVIKPPFSAESMELDVEVKDAIDIAYKNVRTFHQAQAEKEPLVVETMPGVVCSRFARPIARVGLYVPGGTAVLPSTALMLGVPAQVAGCKEIVIATPPRPDGSIVPEVMYVAHLVGASAILKAGGGQAIAAMAYGTETVPKVDKIFGPGNQWVTAAKMLVQNDTDALVAIDMPAGPSEVLVIADRTSNPVYVAADLLSQAEHGVDSQVVLVAVNIPEDALALIEDQVDKQARALPRVDIIRESIAKSLIVEVTSIEEALTFSNDYAPEHLILHLENAKAAMGLVENAGSVFVGQFSPESCGDYASGTNHTLPTNGFARQFSGVNTLSFQKHITSQELTREGLDKLGPVVVTLAEREGLEAHANAVRVRLSEE